MLLSKPNTLPYPIEVKYAITKKSIFLDLVS